MLLLFGSGLWARPATEQEARKVVVGWLRADVRPMAVGLGRQIDRVETYNDEDGKAAYYIVYLRPTGFVIVSADDLVEPVIGFAEGGIYDASAANPLGALVSSDVKGRVAAVGGNFTLQTIPGKKEQSGPRGRWEKFLSLAEGSQDGFTLMGLSSISDVWVAPLLKSKWGQSNVCGNYCYNYYNPVHLRSGCVATAMAQIMRYHEHPAAGIGQHSFGIQVNGEEQTAITLGGNGTGGPYDWPSMALIPNCSTTEAQRQAIGALCYDAGISINTKYKSSSSTANTLKAGDAMTGVFMYGHAIKGYNNNNNIGAGLTGMINPNLDAKDPVILGIKGEGAHAIACDGYGFNGSTMYHHLNMGWDGIYNLWYNLPNIDTPTLYSSVHKCVYNIHISGAGDGEVVSGRVLDNTGEPIPNPLVYAIRDGADFWIGAESDSKGIYAFDGLSSNTNYTVRPVVTGYVFAGRSVRTGRSSDYYPISGNIWGIDFEAVLLAITQITPSSGPVGSYIKIEGRNFGTARGEVVFPNGISGEEVSWADDVIYCRVPAGTTSGEIRIITAESDLSFGKYFDVTNPATICVDNVNSVPDIENGSADYPFSTIQRGIDASTDGDIVVVYPGTYTENVNLNGHNITLTSVEPEQADTVALTVIDGGQKDSVLRIENGEDNNCHVTGFTIVNGRSTNGGGIYCNQSSPIISSCVIRNNQADQNGGAMYNTQSSPQARHCLFINNHAGANGAAAYNHLSNSAMTACTLNGNCAETDGGGIANLTSSPSLLNCIISGNLAIDDGGAIFNNDNSSPTVTNCTLAYNTAYDRGGGIYSYNSNPILANSILWDNRSCSGTDEAGQIYGGEPLISYCCVQGWTAALGGVGNIGLDPVFVRCPDDGGDGWGVGDNDDFGDLRLSQGSGCIDAADNSALSVEPGPQDIKGRPRFLDDPLTCDTGNGSTPVVDMGAYEYASLIGHWKLDETGGITAVDSAGVSNGTLHGNPAWRDDAGRFGGAIELDGIGDYVDCGHNEAFDLTDAITVAAWVSIDEVNNDWQAIVTKGDSAWGLSTYRSSRRMHFAVTGAPRYFQINSTAEVAPGQWHHICGIYDGENIRMYIDGVEDPAEPITYTGGITTNEYDACIGENAEQRGRCWDGMIDDVRVYNYAVAPAEVPALLCSRQLEGDWNHDCLVDFLDFADFASAWLTRPGDGKWNRDYNIAIQDDGHINIQDLTVFAANWLDCAD